MEIVVILDELQKQAHRDERLRQKLLSTRADADPLFAFCAAAREEGFEVYPMDKCMALPTCAEGGSSYDMDIEPDDIDVQDTVTVVWEMA